MKHLYLLTSAFTVFAFSAARAAITCAPLPSCTDLGYDDVAAQCPTDVYGNVTTLLCPFDTSMGKCVREAAVGQIAYFTKAPNAYSGWLLCDGTSKSRSRYPELAKFLDTQFCNSTYHLNTACSASGGTFAVPDYRGYFLRGYAQGSSTSYVNSCFNSNSGSVNASVTIPQKEQLPNLSGHFGLNGSTRGDGDHVTNGLFKFQNYSSAKLDMVEHGGQSTSAMDFNANRYNNIYQTNGHVIPANYAVYAYIYAGKVVK